MSEHQGDSDAFRPETAGLSFSGSQRQRMLQAAGELLAERGSIDGILERSILRSGSDRKQAGIFFSRDVDLIHAIYARVTFEFEERLDELPVDTWQRRFASAMRLKFAIANPYRSALSKIAITALDEANEYAVSNPQTESIRKRNEAVFQRVFHESTNRPENFATPFVRSLYSAHLAMMFAWCFEPNQKSEDPFWFARTGPILELGNQLLASLDSTSSLESILLRLQDILPDESNGAGCFALVPEAPEDKTQVETEILARVFRRRRLIQEDRGCREVPCNQCFALHRSKLRYFLNAQRPIHFVLPAFPAKSPSRSKTLGVKPDKAEEIGLRSLDALCAEIREVYVHGAHVSICSDGHVFSDCVGVSDEDVAEYSRCLKQMIEDARLDSLSIFDMRNVYDSLTYEQMRRRLLETYAISTSELERRVSFNAQQRRLVDGIHRFLFEEFIDLKPNWSRSKCRNACRPLAYETVRRSDAWGKLLSDAFPYALRLSIHPQSAHSPKIGILLGETDDVWLTPWHSTAIMIHGKWTLIKVKDALSMGARVVEQNGVASHFELLQ